MTSEQLRRAKAKLCPICGDGLSRMNESSGDPNVIPSYTYGCYSCGFSTLFHKPTVDKIEVNGEKSK